MKRVLKFLGIAAAGLAALLILAVLVLWLFVDLNKLVNEQVAKAKNLHFILSIADAGVVWVDAGLNVTADVVAALDAATPAAK